MHDFQEIIDLFPGGKWRGQEYVTRCPMPGCYHHDNHLYITQGDNGGAVLYCHKCHAQGPEIMAAIGKPASFLFLDNPTQAPRIRKEPKQSKPKKILKEIPKNFFGDKTAPIERLHNYTQGGEIVAVKAVYRHKDTGKKEVQWWTPDSLGYFSGLASKELPLYNQEAMDSNPGSRVYIVEGEKDVDTMTRLGYVAVSAPHGANEKAWLPSYTQAFTGRSVVIITDNDNPGKEYGEHVAQNIQGVAEAVRIIPAAAILPEIQEHGDITDILERIGKAETMESLNREFLSATNRKNEAIQTGNPDFVRGFLDMKEKKVYGGFEKVVACTSKNFYTILARDTHFENVRFNVIRSAPVKKTGDTYPLWSDADDAEARIYIESIYGIHSPDKYRDGFLHFQQSRKYDPIQTCIERTTWDGKPRVWRAFIDILKADDNPYTREVSRLLFAGGINRAYNPGCKFDDMIIFQGSQGCGKSTFCDWLALDPTLYSATENITGQKGLESIDGKWIVELPELRALRGRDMEDYAKAFLSTQQDTYRKPYDRRPGDYPRHCIFVGSTNRFEYLTDKTGNRRYYPVKVHPDVVEMNKHKTEIQTYLAQCWAEMRTYYVAHKKEAAPTVNPDLLDVIRSVQAEAETEDYREGMIGAYLEGKPDDRVCILEIWQYALHPEAPKAAPPLSRQESYDLSMILQTRFHWVQRGQARFADFGKQRAFYRE